MTCRFKGFARGEVLFLGASGAKRGFEVWEISFRFAASPNVTDLQLGNIVVASKEGRHYFCSLIGHRPTSRPTNHCDDASATMKQRTLSTFCQ